MPIRFDEAMDGALRDLEAQGLLRSLREVDSSQGPIIHLAGVEVTNFSANDYLGLAATPELKAAAIRAVERYGAGAGASRLVCGSLAPHHRLEQALAAFKCTEAALSFSTGYATAVGTICALLTKDDIIILDKLVHASIVDAARLSGATIRVFPHNDLEALSKLLVWADSRRSSSAPGRRARVLVVTESVFSMDGDQSPLAQIVELKDRYGAWLMLDEAHATGLYGERRCGLAEASGVANRVEVQMGTLGKALGSAGGFICGSRRLIDVLVNKARSFIFSTAPVPAAAAAAEAAIALVQSPEGVRLCSQLWHNVDRFRAGLQNANSVPRSAIIPLIVGAETAALQASTELLARRLFVAAIRFPTVARGRARLRVSFSAAHETSHIDHLVDALNTANLQFLTDSF